VGLTAAVLLARHGVRSLVAERHPGTSILPRAFGTNVRTMEIFRVLGLEEAIQAVEVDVGGLSLLLAMQTLDGPVLDSVPFQNDGDPEDPAWPSPTRVSFCAQDVLDPILVQAVRQAGLAELRFGTEVSGLRPDPAGVTAELTDRRDGTRRVVRAEYLIAADGANSSIREALGIGMTGHDISAEVNVLFEADLSRALGAKRAILYRLHNQWLPHGGLFRNVGGGRWTMFTRDTGDARPPRIAEIIRGCAGDPDLDVEILASGAVPGRAGVPGGGCGTPADAGRRIGPEHRHPGGAQPGLEAGRGATRLGRPRSPRHLRGGMAASSVPRRGTVTTDRGHRPPRRVQDARADARHRIPAGRLHA